MAISRHMSLHSQSARNLLENVMDIDTEARAMALVGTEHTHHVMIFWDFLTAFPAVAHGFFVCGHGAGPNAAGAH